ncbi:hypothetical protein MPTK1_2g10300 [Marchantia polymorpha subsp. ruderalis]|nr:hypothetical protein Mp_2g10300 [Marchantia polymorpha subsp. ruderalis]
MKVFAVSKLLWFMRPRGGGGGGGEAGGKKRSTEEAPNAADIRAAELLLQTRPPAMAMESCPRRGHDDELVVVVPEEGPWAGLTGEALAEVFDRLPLEDRMRAVPLVCKDWREAALSPTAWRNVDMGPWMASKADEYCDWESEVDMKAAVLAVVDRSRGQLKRLRTGYCTNEIVDYIAAKCPLLQELSIHHSFMVGDESATNLARRCRKLERLDLSECYSVSAASIRAFGLNCPSLVSFTRNMTDILHYDHVVAPRGDEEAAAIAAHMVSLQDLHMRRMSSLTDSGLLLLAHSCCERLQTLDLACCDSLSQQALDKASALCSKLRHFVRPIKARMHVDPKFMPGLYIVSY